MTKNILFLVNGLGLGNSTRCHAVIQRLRKRGVGIQVFTSGNGLWYFRQYQDVDMVHENQSFNYGSNNGQISMFGTAKSVLHYWRIAKNNEKRIAALIKKLKPDAVITDSDYSFKPMKRFKIPIIALNNANVVRFLYHRFADRPRSIWAQFHLIEYMDYLFHFFIPDLVLAPSLDSKLPLNTNQFKVTDVIVRQGFFPKISYSTPKRVVVMLSGSTFGSPVKFSRRDYGVHIDVVGRDAPEGGSLNSRIVFHGKILNTQQILNDADLLVINGGFSAVSEAFWLRVPMVVVPVARHAEQWINARMIAHLGVGILAQEQELESAMVTALQRLDQFRAAYAQVPAPLDGAEQAAEEIMKII
ncbi:MAG: glycosyltransferase family protein [Nitrospinaceae bacterium]|nr:hypothetical protein [Rhodospirillaceae bacterium]MDP6478389.1 glycosyltransferase family protein [Nitrospinaceae bacterium]